jgi:hypothetical protein
MSPKYFKEALKNIAQDSEKDFDDIESILKTKISMDISEPHVKTRIFQYMCLIDRTIEEEGLKNVIFLTGDRHFTELTELKLTNGKYIYDLTVSPLTSGVNTNPEINILRVPGTAVTEHNFGLLTFSGKRLERKLTIKIFDALGNEKWKKEILSE